MFGSLRTKIVLLLASAGMVAILAAALTIYGLTNAQRLVDRGLAAQVRIEHLLVLAGRMSDYRDAATAAVIARRTSESAARLKPAQEAARRAFTHLLSLNVLEVDNEIGEGKNVAGTKGLLLARMRARFDHLHRSTSKLLEKDGEVDSLNAAFDQFGLGFAPILSRLIDQERMLSNATQEEIAALRRQLLTIATILGAVTFALIVAVYFLIGRPLLQRTADLHDVNRQLAEIDANRRRFFSDISHELRTPLTVVQGEAELNLKAKVSPSKQDMRESFATIQTRVVELRQRIDDMLRVARSESGKLDLASEVVDLNDLARSAVDTEHRFCERHGIDISIQTRPEPVFVFGDGNWLRQVIAGVISNAVKYSEQGNPVKIEVRSLNDQGVVLVKDRGCGIAEQELVQVFERFARAGGNHTSTNPVKLARDGFGVGLSLAKWVVEQHGGAISLVNNTDGPGLLVRISLPLSRDGAPEAKADA
jgi:signal transduction histidine kinase